MAKALSAGAPEYIAVYGSLRHGFPFPEASGVRENLLHRGSCTIPGLLYDLGEYPGLTPGDGSVIGDLYEVRSLSVFRQLDRYECYDPLRPEQSLYRRRLVRLREPPVDAWLYFFNGDVKGKTWIRSGDWVRYRLARGEVRR